MNDSQLNGSKHSPTVICFLLQLDFEKKYSFDFHVFDLKHVVDLQEGAFLHVAAN
jgi:hypothetical protein